MANRARALSVLDINFIGTALEGLTSPEALPVATGFGQGAIIDRDSRDDDDQPRPRRRRARPTAPPAGGD